MALLNIADTIKFCRLLVISDNPTAHIPDAMVLNTENKYKKIIKLVKFKKKPSWYSRRLYF